MSASVQPSMTTVAEFLELPGERHELVDGVVTDMAPASPRHGAILARLARLLGNHLDGHPRCQVVIEPGVQPRVRADINVRIPDLAVTCETIDDDAKLLAEPIVLIEVLSDSNRKDTWRNVWAYISIPSVKEILVLHPGEVRADLLRRQADGSWPKNGSVSGSGEDVVLESIGFRAPLDALYRR